MADEDADVLAELARAVAAGERLPADAASSSAPTTMEFFVLAEIARIHRQALELQSDPSATIGAPPPASIGPHLSVWSHFYLLERLGAGTSGVVYRAWDSHLTREVALKLRVITQAEPAALVVEARRLSRVRHPHFVSVLGVERHEGHLGTWMELLKGQTLQRLVEAGGPLSPYEAALIGADVCSALAAVHGAGLLHRDVKPHNVMREHAGRVVLLDLSASREAEQSTRDLAGTPLYMAPELLTGRPATIASDVYAVGVLLYFLTTGTTPAAVSNVAELRAAHHQGALQNLRDRRPDLPRFFVEIVERAMARAPVDRYQSAGDLERALTAFLSARATPSLPAAGARRFTALRIPLSVAFPLIVVAALAASAVTRVAIGPGSPAEPRAPVNAMRAVSGDQLAVSRALEELAASSALRQDWASALHHYREAERVVRANTSADAPMVGRALLHVAWAQHQSGDLAAATATYELALAKLRDFDLQPLISAGQASLADVHQRAGRLAAAAKSVSQAIEARAITLGLPSSEGSLGLAAIGVTSQALVSEMGAWSIGRDQDGDGLPDLLEQTIGLNPLSVDSDSDGLPDGREDHDRDGLVNDLEVGLPLNPTGVIVHYGSADPEWLGFEQQPNRRIVGRPDAASALPGWLAEAFGYSQYFRSLTSTQRRSALARGWRLSARIVGGVGRTYANLDLGPEGPRFDVEIELDADGQRWMLQRNTSVVPYEGSRERLGTSPDWGLLELEYRPATRDAVLLLGGLPTGSAPSSGHHQFKEERGLFFGNAFPPSQGTPGSAVFRLVMLVIR